MDIREVLRDDHHHMQELANAICESDDPMQAKRLFNQLKEALMRHSRAEERVVYAALAETPDGRAVAKAHQGEVEHELSDRLLQQSTRGRADNPLWKARMQVLRELLEHHVKEEESQVFELLAQHFDASELDVMGVRFEEHKERVRLVTPRNRSHGSQPSR